MTGHTGGSPVIFGLLAIGAGLLVLFNRRWFISSPSLRGRSELEPDSAIRKIVTWLVIVATVSLGLFALVYAILVYLAR